MKRLIVKIRKILGFTRFVATIHGVKYHVDLNEFIDWALYMGKFENDVIEFIKKNVKRGDIFVDIGANTGFYSLLANMLGAVVYSFEPVPVFYKKLQENININTINNPIVLLNVGLSDREYNEEVEIPDSFPIKGVKNYWGGENVKTVHSI